jgi:hypothetical protein
MSKIALQGDASGTGTFTIASPNSNTDRTLTLPDEAGTVLTSASDYLSSTSDIPAANLTGAVPLTDMDQWYLNTNLSVANSGTTYLQNMSQHTDLLIGTGMSESSGVFTFPSNGYWQVTWNWNGPSGSATTRIEPYIEISTNSGSSYGAGGFTNAAFYTGNAWIGGTLVRTYKVTAYASTRIRFGYYSAGGDFTAWNSNNYNSMNFRKVGAYD